MRCVNAHNGTCEKTSCSHFKEHEEVIYEYAKILTDRCSNPDYCATYEDNVWCE